jgi:hypothetical protein
MVCGMIKSFLRAALALAIGLGSATANGADLAFKPADETTNGKGMFSFDTGVLQGLVRLDGKSQGITKLIEVGSRTAVAHGDPLPGVLSYYRIFSTDTRYGHAARDWPTINQVLPDGALQVQWPPAADHPLEITAVYRWRRADTLDLETTVKPQKAMPHFELFLSSYFMPGFRASIYVKPNFFASGKPQFLPADVDPLVDGSYLIFPRDREALQRVFDRRWEIAPDPVQWSVTRWLAAPLAMRRDEATGVTALLMAPPHDCFAVATPYNKTPPDGVAGHQSLYLSLFGQDLAAGETARARTRLVVGRNISDERAAALYGQYLAE